MANSYNSSYQGTLHDEYATKMLLINLIYPVGSVYISINNTSPATLFGGTWVQIQDKFIMCAGSSYTGGSSGGSVTSGGPSNNTSGSTTLTTSLIPAHTHGSKSLSGTITFRTYSGGDRNLMMGTSGIISRTIDAWSGSHDELAVKSMNPAKTNVMTVNATHEHTSVGGGSGHTHTLSSHTHDTTPPYIALYVWQRTA